MSEGKVTEGNRGRGEIMTEETKAAEVKGMREEGYNEGPQNWQWQLLYKAPLAPTPLSSDSFFDRQIAFLVYLHQCEPIAKIHNSSSYLTPGNLFITHLNSTGLEKKEVRDGQLAKNKSRKVR